MEPMDHPRHCVRGHSLVARSKGDPFKCNGCREVGFGRRYQFARQRCPFVLHHECAKARPAERHRTHPLMKECSFKFLWKSPDAAARICDACGMDVRGYLYHDSVHQLDLHPCCMGLESSLSDPTGSMKLILRGKVPSRCVKCKSKDVNGSSSVRGWSYVSSCGHYCYHVSCVKKLILDNWKSGYFISSSSGPRGKSSSRHRSLGSDSRSSVTSSSNTISSRSTSLSRTGVIHFRPWIQTAKVVFSLILLLISGNPIPMVGALAQALLDNT